MYEGDDRVQQVAQLREIAADISFGSVGEGTPEEQIQYFLETSEMPAWFDDHDRALLVEMIEESREESLPALAGATGIPYDTLVRYAREGRILARKSGGVWLSTRRAVEAAGIKPRQ